MERRKTKRIKEQIENADFYKSSVNKIMIAHE